MAKQIFPTLLTGLILVAFIASSAKQDRAKQGTSYPTQTAVSNDSATVYKSGNLTIERLSRHVYQHISFLNTTDFGKVACNGMIVMNGREAIVFDTPASLEGSSELIAYVTGKLQCRITAVIPTHFHEDCVAGLEAFYDHKIPAYASNRTLALLKTKNVQLSKPIKGFDNKLTLTIGDQKVIAGYFVEGHTSDNIIGFYPAGKALFGGCLIKAVGAGKGNLADAHVAEWPETIKNIKQKYPQVKIVIPGHGKWGGKGLLDYTIQLFD